MKGGSGREWEERGGKGKGGASMKSPLRNLRTLLRYSGFYRRSELKAAGKRTVQVITLSGFVMHLISLVAASIAEGWTS